MRLTYSKLLKKSVMLKLWCWRGWLGLIEKGETGSFRVGDSPSLSDIDMF
jgi:hypothetical protein